MIPGAISTDGVAAREALMRFASAYAFLLGGLGLLVFNSPQLAAGQIMNGPVVAGVHLLTLGWISVSIFAALRVFSGVALGSSLNAPLLGKIQWVAWVAGAAVFPCGLAMNASLVLKLGMAALAVGLIASTLLVVPTYLKATRGRLTRAYLAVALLSLWVVFAIGTIAGLRRAGIPLPHPPGYLQSHVLAAVFGWAGATIVGVGAHLLPMFALSREPSPWPIRLAFPFFASVPLLATWGAFVPSPFLALGWVAAGVGSTLWVVQVVIFAKTRLRRQPEPGLTLAAGATGLLGIALVGLLVGRFEVSSVGLLVVGWLTFFTLGVYHRVIPFLVWFQRFSKQIGRGRPPRVDELIDSRLAWFTTGGSLCGAMVWVAGLSIGLTPVVATGSLLMTAAAVAGLLQILPLVRTGSHPTSTPQQAPTLNKSQP